MLGTVSIRGRQVPVAPLLALLVLVNAVWVGHFGLRMHGLAIYDEKFTVEGARWVHGDLSRVFEVPSFGDRGIERLTAILLVPALWVFGTTSHQFALDHLLMALIFSLQAVPAFLLARGLGASVRWSFVGAALAVFGPWAIFGTVFLNNAPAACAAAFALWAMWRAVTTPSPWWDALVLVLVGAASLSRVSSGVLIVAFPAAIIVRAVVERRPRALLNHWLFVLVAVLGLIWLATGHTQTVTGHYPTSVDTTAGVVGERLLTTLAHLSAGTGFVVVAVAIAWLLRQMVRPLSREANVFAILVIVSFGALAYVNLASGIDERYELVLFVPLAVAFAVSLSRFEIQPLLLVAAAVLVWFAVHRHGDLPFVQATDYLTWPSREWLSRVWLNKAQYKLGMERSTAVHLIGLVTVLVAAGLAFARGAIRSRLAAGVAAFALVWSFAGSGWAMQKLSNGLRPQASFAGVSFIDKLAHGEPVPALGSTSETNSAIPTLWSEVQFFNRSVQHTISLEADVYDLCCIPLGQDQVVGIEHSTGAASSAAPLPKWVATVPEWMPAGLATDLVFSSSAYSPAVRLERLRTPARAAWLSTGFDPYGWVRPRRPAQLRVFPAGAPGTPACMRMTITAPMKVRGDSASWVVRELGANRVKTGTIPAGRSERVDIPLAGTDPLELAVDGAAAGPDPVTGQPGILGLSDLRLVKCGAAEPQPKPEP